MLFCKTKLRIYFLCQQVITNTILALQSIKIYKHAIHSPNYVFYDLFSYKTNKPYN